ncbi:MAG: hypothetical protein HYV26_14070, partial [Candidatus Hydrogenedentes bacterium]|nr:hypothetical protein [Candidatus Hydrogenedentota bacterium]
MKPRQPLVSNRQPQIDIFLVSLSLMMFEINLVRLFSVIMWYHLAFFVLAIALFGFGLGGLYSQMRRQRQAPADSPRFLYYLPLLLSAAMVTALLLLAVLPMNEESLTFQVPKLRWMLCAFLLAATPFFFGSMFMALTFASRPAEAGRLYFSDLVGAASGCLGAVAALQWL